MLFELSRGSQLTDAGKDMRNAVLDNLSLSEFEIANHIEATVKAMPDADFDAAIAWYADAHAFAVWLADTFDTSVEIGAGVISAISPRMPWLRNKITATSVFQLLPSVAELNPLDAAKAMGLGFSSNFAMAIQIARGEDIAETLSGVKRRSFFNNIAYPHAGDSVTIDTWMVRVFMTLAGLDLTTATKVLSKHAKALGGTGVGYFVLADACRNVGVHMGILPHQVQAAYWCSVSGSINGGRPDIAG